MINSNKYSTSHNACYDERLYPVIFTRSGSEVKKSFSPSRPVPDSFVLPSTVINVFDFSSDVTSGHIVVFENNGLYFYRLTSSSFHANSIGFSSLCNCLFSLRSFSKSNSWKLVEWEG